MGWREMLEYGQIRFAVADYLGPVDSPNELDLKELRDQVEGGGNDSAEWTFRLFAEWVKESAGSDGPYDALRAIEVNRQPDDRDIVDGWVDGQTMEKDYYIASVAAREVFDIDVGSEGNAYETLRFYLESDSGMRTLWIDYTNALAFAKCSDGGWLESFRSEVSHAMDEFDRKQDLVGDQVPQGSGGDGGARQEGLTIRLSIGGFAATLDPPIGVGELIRSVHAYNGPDLSVFFDGLRAEMVELERSHVKRPKSKMACYWLSEGTQADLSCTQESIDGEILRMFEFKAGVDPRDLDDANGDVFGELWDGESGQSVGFVQFREAVRLFYPVGSPPRDLITATLKLAAARIDQIYPAEGHIVNDNGKLVVTLPDPRYRTGFENTISKRFTSVNDKKLRWRFAE